MNQQQLSALNSYSSYSYMLAISSCLNNYQPLPSLMAQLQTSISQQQRQNSQQQDSQTKNTAIGVDKVEKKTYHDKYQFLFNIHLELSKLKLKNIYRNQLMNNDEIKYELKGGRFFQSIDEFLQKNLYSIYNEQFANKLIAVNKENNNISERQNTVIKLLKKNCPKLNEQLSKQISKKKITKHKTTKKLEEISQEIVKNLQAIIDE